MTYKGVTVLLTGLGMVSISGLLLWISKYFPLPPTIQECDYCGEESCECIKEF